MGDRDGQRLETFGEATITQQKKKTWNTEGKKIKEHRLFLEKREGRRKLEPRAWRGASLGSG